MRWIINLILEPLQTTATKIATSITVKLMRMSSMPMLSNCQIPTTSASVYTFPSKYFRNSFQRLLWELKEMHRGTWIQHFRISMRLWMRCPMKVTVLSITVPMNSKTSSNSTIWTAVNSTEREIWPWQWALPSPPRQDWILPTLWMVLRPGVAAEILCAFHLIESLLRRAQSTHRRTCRHSDSRQTEDTPP